MNGPGQATAQRSTAVKPAHRLCPPRWVSGAMVILLAAVILTGCKGEPKVSDRDLVIIAYDQLRTMMKDRKKPLVLIDVRSVDDFTKEHLPGAINIPYAGDIGPGDPRLAEAHHIVVYSNSPSDYLSPAGAKRLLSQRYQNVFDYREGLRSWKSRGGQVVAQEAAEDL